MSSDELTEAQIIQHKKNESSGENSPKSIKKQKVDNIIDNNNNYHDYKEDEDEKSGSDSDKSYKNVSIKLILNSKSGLQNNEQSVNGKKHIVLPPLDSNPIALNDLKVSTRESANNVSYDYQKQYYDQHYYQQKISPTSNQSTKLSIQNSPNFSPIPSQHRQAQISTPGMPQFQPPHSQYLPPHPHQLPPQMSHPAEALPPHPVEYNMPPGYSQQIPIGYSYSMPGSSSDSSSDLENKRGRRFRRRYNQILRKYNCSYPGCSKSYGSLNHLNTHIVTKKHGQRKSKADFQLNEDSRQHLIYLHHHHHHHHPSNTGEYSNGPIITGSTTGNYWFGYQGGPPMATAGIPPPGMTGPISSMVPGGAPPPPPHSQATSTGGTTPPGITHSGTQPLSVGSSQPGQLPFVQGQSQTTVPQKNYPPPPPSGYYFYPPGSIQSNYPPIPPSHYPGPGWAPSASSVTTLPTPQLPMVASSTNHSPHPSPTNTSSTANQASQIQTTTATTSDP